MVDESLELLLEDAKEKMEKGLEHLLQELNTIREQELAKTLKNLGDLDAKSHEEIEYLESNLPFLATVGSTSPYVGLFGTVWGIMNSFRALGNVQQATLAHVAPGIAEALIATAMGLFAAIPAVIAYNRYAHDVDRLTNRYDNFIEEFLAILQRQSPGRAKGAEPESN